MMFSFRQVGGFRIVTLGSVRLQWCVSTSASRARSQARRKPVKRKGEMVMIPFLPREEWDWASWSRGEV